MDLEMDDTTMQMSQNIISLPIDQRYGGQHIRYLGDLIKQYFGKV